MTLHVVYKRLQQLEGNETIEIERDAEATECVSRCGQVCEVIVAVHCSLGVSPICQLE